MNKARDPLGHVNEIFKPAIAGSDLSESNLKMCNRMKESQTVPYLLQVADITCIYKGKGAKMTLQMNVAYLASQELNKYLKN